MGNATAADFQGEPFVVSGTVKLRLELGKEKEAGAPLEVKLDGKAKGIRRLDFKLESAACRLTYRIE